MNFDNFQEMFNFYMRRCIFNMHDRQLILNEVVHDNDTFFQYIVTPKMHLGRLNYGDLVRISAVL